MQVEGAFLVLSLLQDSAWEAAEQLSLDEIESSSDPFKPYSEVARTPVPVRGGRGAAGEV